MEQKHDYDHFTESVGEQMLLILWTSFATCIVVGLMLVVAL